MRPNFLFAMILSLVGMMGCVPAVHSQTTCELVNIPQEFSPLENCVMVGQTNNVLEITATYTFKRVNRKNVVDTAWTYNVVQTTGTNNGFGLNFVYDYLNEFGYQHTDGMEMHKADFTATTPTGPFAGKTYYYGYGDAYFQEVPGGWV